MPGAALQDRLDVGVASEDADPTRLLQALCAVEAEEGGVSRAAITRLARRFGLPRARVEGVAGFYAFLHPASAARYRVLFSDNITDQMLGSRELMQSMCQALWLEPGRVSEDGLVSIGTTSCTGMCDQGPALLVNGLAITRLDLGRVEAICDHIRRRVPLADWPRAYFRVDSQIRRRDRLLASGLAPGGALRAGLARTPSALIDAIKLANLRGRGGAGYPTGLKWEACRRAEGTARFVVCNADEGEPGTFKDRVLLSEAPDLVFDGMTLCAYAIGARQGFLYLRGEYRYMLPALEAELAKRRAANLLGRNILERSGFDFDIDIHLGAGAYVCGEETALLESLEGRRGVPRIRPPFPVNAGYLHQPTVVNNVETFCAAALIAHTGGEAYRALGTPKSAGTKLFSVSGDCARPGIYEYPFGVSVRQVLDDCGAVDSLAVQVGGPSGLCIDDAEFDRRLAFEDIPCAGAFMVFDASRDMFEVASNFAAFFSHESCGFCTPCRVGTSMQRSLLDKIGRGYGSKGDLAELEKLDQVLRLASHCGLGHTAGNPVRDTLRRFRPAYERRLGSLGFHPAFDLDGALAAARRITGRDDAGAHLRGEA
jgi:[NiFe] hydrogenase diaphorase moiety large subunit